MGKHVDVPLGVTKCRINSLVHDFAQNLRLAGAGRDTNQPIRNQISVEFDFGCQNSLT